ncbi:MAG: sodium:calcium antiporter [Bacilli bacterium]
MPEVMVSADAAIKGQGATAYGNAIGSIICNTALILAITIAVKPSKVDKKSLKTPVIFFFVAALIYVLNAYIFKRFSLASGIVLLLVFVIYMIYTVITTKKRMAQEVKTTEPVEENQNEEEEEEKEKKEKPVWQNILLLVVRAIGIAFGANLLVDNGVIIAGAMAVPESIIALTMIALGTSLPELVTSITSLVKGHGSLSLGNIIGANFFNLVLVSGISTTLSPFDLPVEKTIGGLNASLVVDLPLMIIVMLIVTIPALIKGKLTRAQGIILLVLYASFLVFQFLI